MGREGILAGIAFIALLLPGNCVLGQAAAVGAGSVSMAGVSVGLENAWAAYNNPAGLANYNHFSVATSLEQRFLMKELGHYAMTTTYPVRKACLGFTALFSGYGSFIDQEVSLACGKSFGKTFLTGISLVYIFQKAGSEAIPVHKVSYTLGTIARLSDKVTLAFATCNPFQLYFSSADYAILTSVFKLGLSYCYALPFKIHVELEKDLEMPAAVKLGMEYSFREVFIIRSGIGGFPFDYAFGFAIRKERLLVETAAAYHQFLGFTPVINIQYDFR